MEIVYLLRANLRGVLQGAQFQRHGLDTIISPRVPAVRSTSPRSMKCPIFRGLGRKISCTEAPGRAIFYRPDELVAGKNKIDPDRHLPPVSCLLSAVCADFHLLPTTPIWGVRIYNIIYYIQPGEVWDIRTMARPRKAGK